MRKSSLRRACATLAAVSSLALAATACGGTTKEDVKNDGAGPAASAGKADPGAALKKGLTVGFLPKQVNNPYFTTADKGGEKALAELGSAYKEVGPSSATDTSGQVSYVNTLTQQQVDAIAVSAQDPGALCTALKQAMGNGIKVVTYDSDTTRSAATPSSPRRPPRTWAAPRSSCSPSRSATGARSRSCPPRRPRPTRTPGSAT